MTTLAETMKTIRDSKANIDAFTFPTHEVFASGHEQAKRAATNQYIEATKTLREVIPTSAGGIFITGPGVETFYGIAEDEALTPRLSANGLYVDLTTTWFPAMRNNLFDIDCAASFIQGLRNMLINLEIADIMAPDFSKAMSTQVPDFAAAVKLTKSLMRECVGDGLNVIFLTNLLAADLIKREWDLSLVPVVVTEVEPEDFEGLFTVLFNGNNIKLKVKENAEMNDVILALTHLKKKMGS